MFLISTLFNSICLHKFSHHLSIMMILPAIKSNLCNPLKENCKNMQSSNYTSYRVICKHRRVVSQIEGDGNISNLIIIAIVQHDDNVDGSPQILSVGVTGWRNDGMAEWRADWLSEWLTEVGLTTCLLPRRHLAMTLPCNCTPLLGSGDPNPDPGATFRGWGNVYWVYAMSFIGPCACRQSIYEYLWQFLWIFRGDLGWGGGGHGGVSRAPCQAARHGCTGCDNEYRCTGVWAIRPYNWYVCVANTGR